ncbi:MAG TPA: hypothetical protein VF530_07815 [Planctomycetota bacterium]
MRLPRPLAWGLLGLVCALGSCRAPAQRLSAVPKPGWGRVGGLEPERVAGLAVAGARAPERPLTGLRGAPGWDRASR